MQLSKCRYCSGFFFPSVSGRFFLLASIVPKSLQGCALIMYRYSTSDIVTVSNVCVCVFVLVGVVSMHTLHLPSLVAKTTRKSLQREL